MRALLVVTTSVLALTACGPGEDAEETEAGNAGAEETMANGGSESGAGGDDTVSGNTDMDAETDGVEGEDLDADSEPAEWGYEGDIAAANWGSLSEDWATCDAGDEQSPIDLTDVDAQANAVPSLNWSETGDAEVVDNGHTIQVNTPGAGGLRLFGETYELAQFHFHAGSEHTINGEQYPLEVHFVHVGPDDALAVIGVMFEVGEENEALAPIWNALPDGEGSNPLGESLDPISFAPGELGAWRYSGSLTTPPCSEGVAWTVMETPITLSQEQLDAYTARYPNNFRPVQPLNDRELMTGEVEAN